MASLEEITAFLDDTLRVGEVTDYAGAFNGLQIANSGTVSRVCAAVDAGPVSIREAAAKPNTLLLVHHGLFWQGVQMIAGAFREKVKRALDGELAVYSAHLPLDLHPVIGNNALLCHRLELGKTTPFFHEKGQAIGLQAAVDLDRAELSQRLAATLEVPVKLIAAGPERVRRVGVVTGGAGSDLARAALEGVDTFITGEGPHWTFTAAEELGINVFYGGHYATETFGVKALAAQVAERFGIPWSFIDHPSGL